MRIAQIAPLYEAVPPKLYGGTERVVYHLCNELVRRGHDVTLFASGDSKTDAKLVPCRKVSLRLDPDDSYDVAAHQSMFIEIRQRALDFDLLHFHTGIDHFAIFKDISQFTLTTMHGRQNLKDLPRFYGHYPDFPLVSISNNQRVPVPDLNWVKTIYHGYPKDQYEFSPKYDDDRHLAFLGRVSPEKGIDKAIEIAKLSGYPLRVAAKIDPRTELMPTDRKYAEEHILPLLTDDSNVEFIGEIGESEKSKFLGAAKGVLFPVSAPEAFGLVMIEAMACGTPVIAFNKGSIPEVIDDGRTGFIVENVEEAVEAVKKLKTLDRARIRRMFEKRFDIQAVGAAYEKVYKQLLGL